MAKTQDFLTYLDDRITIAPANSQEEYLAAQTIADVMTSHGVDVNVEEFDSPALGDIPQGLLQLLLFAGIILSGTGQSWSIPVGILLALIGAVPLLVEAAGNPIVRKLAGRAVSQNVVGFHEATGPAVIKGARPIVIVAHYDTPHESFLYGSQLSRYLALIRSYRLVLIRVVLVAALFQILVFLPDIVRTIAWVLGIVAALPLVLLGVGSVAEHFAPCTPGVNDNKSSVAAMLGVLADVRPTAWKPEITGRRAQAEADAAAAVAAAEAEAAAAALEAAAQAIPPAEEVVGVRHGQHVIEELGLLPRSCEIEYVSTQLDPIPMTETDLEGYYDGAKEQFDELVDQYADDIFGESKAPKAEEVRSSEPEPEAEAGNEVEIPYTNDAPVSGFAAFVERAKDVFQGFSSRISSAVTSAGKSLDNAGAALDGTPKPGEMPVPASVGAFSYGFDPDAELIPVPEGGFEADSTEEMDTVEIDVEPDRESLLSLVPEVATKVEPEWVPALEPEITPEPEDEIESEDESEPVAEAGAVEELQADEELEEEIEESVPLSDEEIEASFSVEPYTRDEPESGFSSLASRAAAAFKGIFGKSKNAAEDVVEVVEEIPAGVAADEAAVVEEAEKLLDDTMAYVAEAEETVEEEIESVAETAEELGTELETEVEAEPETEADEVVVEAESAAETEPAVEAEEEAEVETIAEPEPEEDEVEEEEHDGDTAALPVIEEETEETEETPDEVETAPAFDRLAALKLIPDLADDGATVAMTREDFLRDTRFALDMVEGGNDDASQDSAGLYNIGDSLDLAADAPANPEPVDDPTWGQSTYNPPKVDIGRRATLFDLPDPSENEVDPFLLGTNKTDRKPLDENGGWKGGAALRADLRETDETEIEAGFKDEDAEVFGVPAEEELREAVLTLGDDNLIAHDIWFVALGASAMGNAGMNAFLDAHRRDIRGAFLINLDCVGAGELTLLTEEGEGKARHCDRRISRLFKNIASDLHAPLKEMAHRWGDTDATPAMRKSVRSITVMGCDESGLPAYSRQAEDDLAIVDPKQIALVNDLVSELIRRS